MRGQSLVVLAVFSTYLISTAVEGVRPFYRPESALFRRTGQRFKPSHSKCCKIGEKTAKRRMPCVVGLQHISRRFNSVHRAKSRYSQHGIRRKTYGKALANKINKCSTRFAKNFEKCCNYRAQLIKELQMCKRRPGRERKHCRTVVRRRYP